MKKYFYLLTALLIVLSGKISGQSTVTGTDAFGYKYSTDANAADPAVYQWVDISTTGTQLTGLGDDNVISNIPLGINFKYYWNTYSSCAVGSNGYIMFGDNQLIAQSSSGMPNIPTADTKNNFIAPFMADLTFVSNATGEPLPDPKVYYQTIGNRFIISFINVPFWNNNPAAGPQQASGSNTFQLILDGSTNDIFVNYQSCVGPWFTGSSVIMVQGMENITGQLGVRWRRKSTTGTGNIPLPPANSATKVIYPSSSTYTFRDISAKALFAQDNKGAAVFKNTTNTLRAFVQNAGTVKFTTPITVRAFIYDESGTDVYNDQVVLDSMQSGEEKIVIFPTTFNSGNLLTNYKVELKTTATGDQYPANNSKLAKLVVLDSSGGGKFDVRFTSVNPGTGALSQTGSSGMVFDAPFYPMVISGFSIDLMWPDPVVWAGLNNPGVEDSLTPNKIRVYLADGPNGGIGTLLDSFTIASPSDFPYDTVGTDIVSGQPANNVFRFKRTLPNPYSWFGGKIYIGAILNLATNFVWNSPYQEIYKPGTPASGRSLEITGSTWGENRSKDSVDVGFGIIGDPLGVVATIPNVKTVPLSVDQNIPNPASEHTKIGVVLPKAGQVSVTLRDVTGREVRRQQFVCGAGKHNLTVNLDGLTPQLYFYTVQHESGTATKRLIVK